MKYVEIVELVEGKKPSVLYLSQDNNLEFIEKLRSIIRKFAKILFTKHYVVILEEDISDIKLERLLHRDLENPEPRRIRVYKESFSIESLSDEDPEKFLESFSKILFEIDQ